MYIVSTKDNQETYEADVVPVSYQRFGAIPISFYRLVIDDVTSHDLLTLYYKKGV
ncbi:hypothetical protein [Gracilibacillus halophilus]|uniref:hypothetical protein n=1 Tax=Gracilibacillus halophilus TaxID=470864 RepID=UPI0003A8B8B6|nr:hypothetical protein [Gracilibacillus halophilus]